MLFNTYSADNNCDDRSLEELMAWEYIMKKNYFRSKLLLQEKDMLDVTFATS